jgi:microcystin degradation protein MlrC
VRSQAVNTAMCTQLGCDLTGKQIVVVKSAQHFYASYAQWARRVLSVKGSGQNDVKMSAKTEFIGV